MDNNGRVLRKCVEGLKDKKLERRYPNEAYFEDLWNKE